MFFLSFLAAIAGTFGAVGAYLRWLAPAFGFYLCLGALAVIALNLPISLLRFIRRGRRDVSVFALLFGVAAVGVLGVVFKFTIENPITDVTNHLAAPPGFHRAISSIPAPGMQDFVGSSFHLSRDYNPEFAEKQKRAYPDIHVLFVGAPAVHTFSMVKNIIAKHPEWKQVWIDENAQAIELEAELPFFHSVDDFLVTVVDAQEGSIVFLRSRSRFGFTDFGSNAKRIRDFSAELTNLGNSMVPPMKVEAQP